MTGPTTMRTLVFCVTVLHSVAAADLNELRRGADNCTHDDSHGDESIFQLEYGVGLGSVAGLGLMTGMVAFMIIADRLQVWTERAVEGDKAMEVFIQRVWVELMMFGLVAITLFMLKQQTAFPMAHSTHLQWEFADIFCSMAACLLIFGGASLLLLLEKISATFHSYQVQIHTFHLSLADGSIDFDEVPRRGHFPAREFFMAAADFLGSRNVNPNFDFGLYMRECYCDTLSKLINIEWPSWVVLNLIFAIALVWVAALNGSTDTFAITLVFIILCWATFVSSICLFCRLSSKINKFRQHLQMQRSELADIIRDWRSSEERQVAGSSAWKDEGDISFMIRLFKAKEKRRLIDITESAGQDPNYYTDSLEAEVNIDIHWSEWYFQVINLVNTSLAALFIMHVGYNIGYMEGEYQVAALYEILCVVPIVGVFCTVPYTAIEITLAKAFVSPNPDMIDGVIMQQQAVNTDLLYVQQQILSMAEKTAFSKISTANKLLTSKGELQKFLARLHINVARNRLERMMHLLDADQDGVVSVEDFFTYAGFPKGTWDGSIITHEEFESFRQNTIRSAMRGSMNTLQAGKHSTLRENMQELETILEDDVEKIPSITPPHPSQVLDVVVSSQDSTDEHSCIP